MPKKFVYQEFFSKHADKEQVINTYKFIILRFGNVFRRKKSCTENCFPFKKHSKCSDCRFRKDFVGPQGVFWVPTDDRGVFPVRTKPRMSADFSAFLCNRPCM